MRLDVGSQATWRVLQAVLLSRPHRDAVPPPCQEGTQLFRLRGRERTGRRAPRRRTVGDGTGIEGIGFGQLPGGVCKVPALTGLDHYDGSGRRRQRGHHSALIAPRGFEHTERWSDLLEAGDSGGTPRRIVRDRPTFARGAQGNITGRGGNIYTNTDLRDSHDNSSLAPPCRMRARWHRPTVRALGGQDATTHAPLRSQRTQAVSV
jgi:hypothetical protein